MSTSFFKVSYSFRVVRFVSHYSNPAGTKTIILVQDYVLSRSNYVCAFFRL